MSEPIASSQMKTTISRAFHLIWSTSPGWTSINLVLVLVQGILPLAALYLTKLIVDTVTAGVMAPDKAAAFQPVLFWVMVAAGVALAIAVVQSLSGLASEAQSLTVTDAVSDILHAQSVTVDLEYYENPEYYDTLHRAQQEAPYRPTRIINGLVQIGRNGISLMGVAGLMFAFNAWVGLILVAASLPAAYARFIYARKLYGFEQEQTKVEREAGYYHWVLTDSGHAKEVRLFTLGPLVRERFRRLRSDLRKGRLGISTRRSLNDILSQSVATIAIFGILGYIAFQAIGGQITVGDLVMYYLAFQLGLVSIQAILAATANLYEDNLFLTNYYRFLDLEPKVQAPSHPVAPPETPRQGVEFHDVRFTYPGGTREILSGVSLALRPGEVIALVGENGSGKSTLIKLFCRLYDPDGGEITVDGISLRDFAPEAWRSRLAVLFQDFVHFQLTARENIWIGDVGAEPGSGRIARAAEDAGADTMINGLPAGYDTRLGCLFAEGKELSTGEWQKVALARSFFRDTPFVILDEPTSSMDPLAESALFHRFKKLLKGRSAILVSHRFSTVQMADHIYLLEKGRIAEHGTHEELLRQNGKYALLYRTQAQFYHSGSPAPGIGKGGP